MKICLRFFSPTLRDFSGLSGFWPLGMVMLVCGDGVGGESGAGEGDGGE